MQWGGLQRAAGRKCVGTGDVDMWREACNKICWIETLVILGFVMLSK